MKARLFVSTIFAALILSGCTIYLQPGVSGRISIGIELHDIIAVFEPSRGASATYFIGEPVVFRIFANQSGYITLSAIDPDGRVYTFARNMAVVGGMVNALPGPSDRFVFLADRPTGFHRIRASFTDRPTDTGRVTYVGRRGDGEWTSTITVELNTANVRDVSETNLFIQ